MAVFHRIHGKSGLCYEPDIRLAQKPLLNGLRRKPVPRQPMKSFRLQGAVLLLLGRSRNSHWVRVHRSSDQIDGELCLRMDRMNKQYVTVYDHLLEWYEEWKKGRTGFEAGTMYEEWKLNYPPVAKREKRSKEQ